LPNEAPDIDLEPGKLWLVGRDAGLVADVVADREADVLAAMAVPNTLALRCAARVFGLAMMLRRRHLSKGDGRFEQKS
jgi:hypothetical protein